MSRKKIFRFNPTYGRIIFPSLPYVQNGNKWTVISVKTWIFFKSFERSNRPRTVRSIVIFPWQLDQNYNTGHCVSVVTIAYPWRICSNKLNRCLGVITSIITVHRVRNDNFPFLYPICLLCQELLAVCLSFSWSVSAWDQRESNTYNRTSVLQCYLF